MTAEKTKKSAHGALIAGLGLTAALMMAPLVSHAETTASLATAQATDSAPVAPVVGGNEKGPSATIDAFHETLIGVMKSAATTDEAHRREVLKPAIEGTFDLPYMAEKTTGRFWTDMSDDDKATLVGIFTRLTIANFADRFDGFSGQSFVTEAEQSLGADKLLVRSALVKADGEKVAINYMMHETDRGWSVIDIYLAGKVSELATRRSDFYATLRDKGVSGLIDVLTEKVAQLEAGPSSPPTKTQ